MIDRDAVVAALRPADVIARFALAGKRIGDEFRTRVCPTCGARSRADAVAINMTTGRWRDHAHSCSGDLLGLVAGLLGCDVRRDFERVLQVAADIAGITGERDDAAIARALSERRQREREASDARLRERIEAMRAAGRVWRGLRDTSELGAGYLRHSRGLDARKLESRGLVRYWHDGSPAVALWSSDGSIRNVVRRCIVGDIKVKGLPGCPTSGTLVMPVSSYHPDPLIVLTEGVADTLTACLAWPDALVIGAHGAAEMPNVALGAARRCRRYGRVDLLIVAHNDPRTSNGSPGVGRARADEAAATARAEGAAVRVLELEHKDLNDAWRQGWRPS